MIFESITIRIIKVRKKENTQANLLDQAILIDFLGTAQNDTISTSWGNWSTVAKCMCYMRSKHSLIQKYLLTIYYVPGAELGSKNIRVNMIQSLPSLSLQSGCFSNFNMYWSLLKKILAAPSLHQLILCISSDIFWGGFKFVLF